MNNLMRVCIRCLAPMLPEREQDKCDACMKPSDPNGCIGFWDLHTGDFVCKRPDHNHKEELSVFVQRCDYCGFVHSKDICEAFNSDYPRQKDEEDYMEFNLAICKTCGEWVDSDPMLDCLSCATENWLEYKYGDTDPMDEEV